MQFHSAPSVSVIFSWCLSQKKYPKVPFKQIEPSNLIVVVVDRIQEMALCFPQKVKISHRILSTSLRHSGASRHTVSELEPKGNVFLKQHLNKISKWAIYRILHKKVDSVFHEFHLFIPFVAVLIWFLLLIEQEYHFPIKSQRTDILGFGPQMTSAVYSDLSCCSPLNNVKTILTS